MFSPPPSIFFARKGRRASEAREEEANKKARSFLFFFLARGSQASSHVPRQLVRCSSPMSMRARKRARKKHARRRRRSIEKKGIDNSMPPSFFFLLFSLTLSPLFHPSQSPPQDLLGPELARPLHQKRQDPVFGEEKGREEKNSFCLPPRSIERGQRRGKKTAEQRSAAPSPWRFSSLWLLSLAPLSSRAGETRRLRRARYHTTKRRR